MGMQEGLSLVSRDVFCCSTLSQQENTSLVQYFIRCLIWHFILLSQWVLSLRFRRDLLRCEGIWFLYLLTVVPKYLFLLHCYIFFFGPACCSSATDVIKSDKPHRVTTDRGHVKFSRASPRLLWFVKLSFPQRLLTDLRVKKLFVHSTFFFLNLTCFWLLLKNKMLNLNLYEKGPT